MVAHRLVESLVSCADEDLQITVIGGEGRLPYDRVGLTGDFSGVTPSELGGGRRRPARMLRLSDSRRRASGA
ncbi:hypothetical protein ACTU6U_06365 [Microbacterium sp. A196]|uniref:hypothetical protein n=1 Tax=Microbacterium sp. A196 TaxID=3457320 RepID=UPI003FD2A522